MDANVLQLISGAAGDESSGVGSGGNWCGWGGRACETDPGQKGEELSGV